MRELQSTSSRPPAGLSSFYEGLALVQREKSSLIAGEGTHPTKTSLPRSRFDGLATTAIKESTQPPKKTVPYGPERELAALRSSLQSYGRSIIKSALDHPAEAAEGLEKDIAACRENVIVRYNGIIMEAKSAREKNRRLEETNASLDIENGVLKRTMETDSTSFTRNEKRYKTQLADQAAIIKTQEEKIRTMTMEAAAKDTNDKKRKRKEVGAIWEKAEKTRLDV